MTTRRKRLEKLVAVQGQLKAYHGARHAGLVAAAMQAGEEAREIAARFDDPASLSALFPGIYHDRIAQALERERRLTQQAETAAQDVAVANARETVVARNHRDAVREETRQREDRERLEMIQDRARHK